MIIIIMIIIIIIIMKPFTLNLSLKGVQIVLLQFGSCTEQVEIYMQVASRKLFKLNFLAINLNAVFGKFLPVGLFSISKQAVPLIPTMLCDTIH